MARAGSAFGHLCGPARESRRDWSRPAGWFRRLGLLKYPGTIVPMGDIRRQSKWSG